MPVPDGAFLNLACSTCEQVQRTARTGNLCALSSSASCCDAILWRLLHRVLFVVCLAFLSVSLGLVLFSLSPIICFRVLCFGLSFVFFCLVLCRLSQVFAFSGYRSLLFAVSIFRLRLGVFFFLSLVFLG